MSQPQPQRGEGRKNGAMPWQWLDSCFGERWEFLREGFLQLALAAVWKSQCNLLDETLAGQVKEEVLRPFLARTWLPGTEEACDHFTAEDFPGVPSDAIRAVEAAAGAFVRLWPGEQLEGHFQSGGSDLKERRGILADLLAQSFEEARQAGWRPTCSVPGRLPDEQAFALPELIEEWVPLWAGQAQALAAWQRIDGQVERDLLAATKDCRQRARRLLERIGVRNELQGGALWRGLVWMHSPADFKLFGEIHDVLRALLDRVPEESLPEPGCVLGIPLPAGWPPLLLARLQAAISMPLLLELEEPPRERESLTRLDFPCGARARVALVCAILEKIEAGRSVPPSAGERGNRFVEDLLSSRGITLDLVQRVLEEERESVFGSLSRPESKPAGAPARQVVQGLPELIEAVEQLAGDGFAPLQEQMAVCKTEWSRSPERLQRALEQFFRTLYSERASALRADLEQFARIELLVFEVFKHFGVRRYKARDRDFYKNKEDRAVQPLSGWGRGKFLREIMPGLCDQNGKVLVKAIAEYE